MSKKGQIARRYINQAVLYGRGLAVFRDFRDVGIAVIVASHRAVIAALKRCASQNQVRENLMWNNFPRTSHPCAKNAQGWDATQSFAHRRSGTRGDIDAAITTAIRYSAYMANDNKTFGEVIHAWAGET